MDRMKKTSFIFCFIIAVLLIAEAFIISCLILNDKCDAYDLYDIVRDVKTLIFLGVVFILNLVLIFRFRKIMTVLFSALTFLLLCLSAGFCVFRSNAGYRNAGHSLNNVFFGHKVMLIVPHEDDDLNVFGGIFEQYVDYGSEVYTVFVTNGDYLDLGETRINEAIACMKECGIPEDHVVFLGYGDQWADGGPHIYNSPSDTPIRSYIGYSETYGTDSHLPYRDSEYTSDHYFSDIKNVILEHKPDIIYCVDYDAHVDHMATSLAFEKVFGQILKEHPEYRPTVLKGFAYGTAWYAPEDFYSINILSTQNPKKDSEYYINAPFYRWDARLRLPVSVSSLSRSIQSSAVYKELSDYASQSAALFSKSIINGDKVFWERSTASLCYRAEISASSGSSACINDFMLRDNYDLINCSGLTNDGIWIPDQEDENKSIEIRLSAPSDIGCIYLYDNPSETDNILNARIILDNGKTFDSGALDKFGAPTGISIGEEKIRSVTIVLESAEGSYAGLTEVEMYQSEPRSSFHFVKLTDENDNFIYDYVMPDEKTELSLYHVGDAPELSREAYTVECSNGNCSAEIAGDRIIVTCPKGEGGLVHIADKSGKYSDSVYVSNKLNFIGFWQNVEDTLFAHLIPFSEEVTAKFCGLFQRIFMGISSRL